MSQAGPETIARWREAGEWWIGEPYREFHRYIDSKGIWREESSDLPVEWLRTESAEGTALVAQEDHREDWSLRMRKVRDEKVAKACGYLPDEPNPSFVVHKPVTAAYAPLHSLSGYAIGRGTMLAEEIPVFAANEGIPAIALTDPFSLMGAVEFSRMARKLGVKPIVGSCIELPEGGEIVLIARNALGYRNLSQLITECHLDEPRLFPLASWERLEHFADGLICLTGGDGGPLNRHLSRRNIAPAEALLRRLIHLYHLGGVFIEIERSSLPWENSVNDSLLELADRCGVIPVAGGTVTHARREHFPAQDMLACIETLCTVDEVDGRKPCRAPEQPQALHIPRRALNAERFLRTSLEMRELFADRPELLSNTLRVAELCDDDVMPKRTVLPALYPDDRQALREITFVGAHLKHPKITKMLRKRLEYELIRIGDLGFAGHFLVAWDMCRWANEQEIHHSGRGSVVDSAVAYCLGLSRIDAFTHRLHFDRFLPADGSKRPDIDIDFEAARRDDVRNYLSNKYGQDKVATVCAVGTYCTRGIVREVGKAMGFSDEAIGFLAKRIHGGVHADRLESAFDTRPELRNSGITREKFNWIFRLSERLMDVPRNIRSHSSGVVVSSEPISFTTPVMESGAEGVRILQWDKRSAKHYFDKFDILCLRGHDVLSGTQRIVRGSDIDFSVEAAPIDDPETYRAMRSGHLIGIPQSASPAMRQAHIRMKTENLHDASLVQAGIRPGVGGAVKLNELIARRRGKPYGFAHPELERILGNTYGIVVFQEQIDQLLQTFCGYTSGQAEDLRDSIHKRRRENFVDAVKQEIVSKVIGNGFGLETAEHVYDLVAGFQGYGFAQGHALAFAEISIRSIYCQQNYPSQYFTAILNAQPAGYYGPCTLVNEARCRGIAILPADVNRSKIDFTVEDVVSCDDPKIVLPQGAIRIGLAQVKALSAETATRIVEMGPFSSLFDLAMQTEAHRDELEALVLCGACDTLTEQHAEPASSRREQKAEINRRTLLWNVAKAVKHCSAFRKQDAPSLPFETPEPKMSLVAEDFGLVEKAVYERAILGLDIDRHLMAFERCRVRSRGGLTGSEAGSLPNGTKAFVVGNPIRLRFPPTASGRRVVFFDLEDETGLLNVTCFDDAYQRDGHNIVCSPFVTIVGEAQDRDGHTAFLAHRIFAYKPSLRADLPPEAQLPVATADFLTA